MLWTLFFAVYAAIFSSLPATPFSFAVSTTITVLFAIGDAFTDRKNRFAGWFGVSYFACGLAYAVAIGYLVLVAYPPAVPPKPPIPFWSAAYHVISGGLIRDIGRAIATAIATFVYYLMTTLGCTITSTVIALLGIRRHREAKWLLILNIPGILLLLYVLGGIVYDELLAG